MKKKISIILIITIVFVLVLNLADGRLLYRFISKEQPEIIAEYNEKTVTLTKNTYVYFGKYNGSHILWKIKDIKENKPMLISEKAICQKAFGTFSEELEYGSSNYEKSSLKKWLNSKEEKVDYGNGIPDKNHIYKGYNSYENEEGFLNGKKYNF